MEDHHKFWNSNTHSSEIQETAAKTVIVTCNRRRQNFLVETQPMRGLYIEST